MPGSLRAVMSSSPEERVFTGESAFHLTKLSEDLCCNILKIFLNVLKGRFYIYICIYIYTYIYIYKSIHNFTLTFIIIIWVTEVRN